MFYTTDDLLDQVRSQLDETNATNATDAQLLQALNRGQRKATNITARKYDSLFWNSTTFATVAGQRAYSIPDDAYGRRIEKLEIRQGEIAWEVKRISNHKRTQYITASQVQRPYYYTLRKNELELYPKPSGGLTVEVHYTDAPERLVKSQGRITNIGSDFVLVDTLGSEISASTTGFAAYANFIDYTTGEVKGTAQVAIVDAADKKITFKTGGLTRTSVLGKTVSTSFPTDLEQDDLVCLVTGTCVPELPEAYGDYLTQFAVVEIRRRFGEDTSEEFAALKEQESELEKMWAGREASHRIRKASGQWSSSLGGNLRRLLS